MATRRGAHHIKYYLIPASFGAIVWGFFFLFLHDGDDDFMCVLSVCFLSHSTGLVNQTRYELSTLLSQAINAQILVGVVVALAKELWF